MKLAIALVLCVVVSWATSWKILGKPIPNFAGPFKVVVRRFQPNSDYYNTTGEIVLDLHQSHYKHGQLQYFWGSASHSIPLDDTLKIHTVMNVWANNQWKKNAFVYTLEHACTDMRRRFQGVSEFIHGEDGRRCPIGQGSWVIENQTFDVVFPDVPIFPYGHYQYNNIWAKGNKYVGVFTADVEVVPRV